MLRGQLVGTPIAYRFLSCDYRVFGYGGVAFSEANSNTAMNIYRHAKDILIQIG